MAEKLTMHLKTAIDPGRSIDWSLTSIDYAAHRPGPPSDIAAGQIDAARAEAAREGLRLL